MQISFEFFPPKTDKAEESLWQTIERLAPLKPRFVSVTYGAGGTTRERTHATVTRIRRETELEPAAHLTCVAASRDEIDAIARAYWDAGIRHIVALRGDPPDGAAEYLPQPDGYAYAVDLVEGLRKIADFEISVAAYPETHPAAPSAAFEIDYLKRKIDAGATRAITQFFFDADIYLRFRDRLAANRIDIPLVPGILPITNFATAAKFAGMCGARIPDWMGRLYEGLDDDPEARQLVAATQAAELCRRLQAEGVDEFHFYTLNRAELTWAICRLLGAAPALPAAA
ncbi:MAG: methylenetetrahydrofolate reductase [Alphaproteobacteria bacterium]|nr:methylenetetrahydrofolate reductase [Alphaproteobacteria bacterium]MCB9928565.1 methylenetetrahydrofolate reductase [Alphaproteobacteria bacterium]